MNTQRSSAEVNTPRLAQGVTLPLAWVEFIRYCGQLGHGEIERLKIQDGLPMLAEQAIKKVRFGP